MQTSMKLFLRVQSTLIQQVTQLSADKLSSKPVQTDHQYDDHHFDDMFFFTSPGSSHVTGIITYHNSSTPPWCLVNWYIQYLYIQIDTRLCYFRDFLIFSIYDFFVETDEDVSQHLLLI